MSGRNLAILYMWDGLKDSGGFGVMGLVGVATFAVSSFAMGHTRSGGPRETTAAHPCCRNSSCGISDVSEIR